MWSRYESTSEYDMTRGMFCLPLFFTVCPPLLYRALSQRVDSGAFCTWYDVRVGRSRWRREGLEGGPREPRVEKHAARPYADAIPLRWREGGRVDARGWQGTQHQCRCFLHLVLPQLESTSGPRYDGKLRSDGHALSNRGKMVNKNGDYLSRITPSSDFRLGVFSLWTER